MEKILVVEDEAKMREILKTVLSGEGFEVLLASRAEEALSLLKTEAVDLMISDIRMPGFSGIELFYRQKEQNLNVPTILITAYGTVESAVKALRDGVFDYLVKPFDLDEMKIAVKRALNATRLTREVEKLRREVRAVARFGDLLGKSAGMQKVFETIHMIAPSDATVLIMGESGTGKELVAKAIHDYSPRREKPCIALNCSALPETLLESELFGFMKGAFTDAARDKPGYLEIAQEGTLFLDEIGDMSLNLQTKLLRVLEDRTFMRLGGTKPQMTQVRFIAATNQNLKEKIADGKFREDLYFRINVVPVHLPPLRERPEDILLLCQYFLDKFSEKTNRSVSISQEALNMLAGYPWPGNVRELEHALERAVLLTKGEVIDVDVLPQEVREKTVPFGASSQDALFEVPLKEAKFRIVGGFEKTYLEKILKDTNGNVSQAAKKAGITRMQFHRKIKEYGLKHV